MEPGIVKPSLEACAREILDVAPLVMRGIRNELRKRGAKILSVPQFRTLGFISRHQGTSLSEVAEHIGLTLPAMSTLIDGLVARNYAVRKIDPDDRRRMTLTLSDTGQRMLQSAREGTQAHLARQLSKLQETDRRTIVAAMRILRGIFGEVET